MPRKKKEQPPPPAPKRSIKCAFCQKELDPQKDEVTFIGMGKWRDGPGLVHAVCSAKTQEGQENPCFLNGMGWATKFTKSSPVLMTFEEWKALPIHRRVTATRTANGRYQLHLSESYLNCFYFLEHKHAANAEKAKRVIERWQSEWNLFPEDVPDIEQLEREARQEEETERFFRMPLTENPPVVEMKLPEELKKELDRHLEKHLQHFRENVIEDGDDCKSCRISRGIRKMHAIALWRPVIERALETIATIKESDASFGCYMADCRKILDKATVSLCEAMGFRSDDEKHNELARKRNDNDLQCAKAFIEKFGGSFRQNRLSIVNRQASWVQPRNMAPRRSLRMAMRP